MGRINLLFCIEYLANGGTEKQLMSLIAGLDKTKFKPHLCCLKRTAVGISRRSDADRLFSEINCSKIRLDFFSFYRAHSLLQLLKLMRFIRENNIQIIQTYFQDPAIVGLLAGKLCGVKNIIASFRDLAFWYQRKTDRKMKLIYNLFQHYIANSKAVQDKYVEIFGLPDDKFTVLYNGVDIEKFREPFRREKINSDIIVVGIIANLNRQVKRVDVFLKAAAFVLNSSKNFKFVVMGDGELKNGLSTLAQKLGIIDSVDFVGRVNNINQWLSKIDIGVNSSDSEGLPNSILEFMAAGIPVAATDVGGNGEVVVDGVTGYLVPRGDYMFLADKILQIADNHKEFEQMQNQSINIVNSKFSMHNYLKGYEKFYERLQQQN